MKRTAALRTLALGVGMALLATACGSGSSDAGDGATTPAPGSSSAAEKVTVTWWHNSNTAPGKDYYDQVAKDFEAENAGVTIKVEAMQHDDMRTKLDAAFQSGDAPDIYMERGGGELAAHVEAGLTKDLSDVAADTIATLGSSVAGWQVDGKTYGLPFSMGVVGFWYNKAIFEQAGIAKAPTTMDELYTAADKLKAAGVEPISVGVGEKWPAAHYWYYFVLRECSQKVLADAVGTLDFSDPCFVKAGTDLENLVAAEPFNTGFLSTPAQKGPTSASALLATGRVAMELAGHWEPGVMQGLTEDKKGLGDNTGWFAFPAVSGGAGDAASVLGGGDAWAVSKDAPDAAVDFVKYLLSDKVQKGFAEQDMGLPTNPTANQYVKDPALKGLLDVRDASPFVQLYFDTAFGPAVGGAMNDAIALVFASSGNAQGIVDATQAAADAEK